MSLRRAFWALSLSVSVAILAHLVVFGTSHAPGATHAPELLGTLGALLGLSVFGAFLGGALGLGRTGAAYPPMPPTIATKLQLRYGAPLLAVAAAGTFALIEISEGHLALGPWFAALVACLPLAFAALAVARATHRAAHAAGVRVAGLIGRLRPARPAIILSRRTRSRTFATAVARGARRGRAPPPFI
jgi:hypothetical protein